jgi:site-specific DNA-methyltransferase (adenine-specific)
MFTLHNGDCLQVLPSIPSGSIDAIITDLPYGTTACKWDTVIEFAPMWKEVKRVLKPNGTFITTASQPFTSALIMSNPKAFRICWYWRKERGTNFQKSRTSPMKVIEECIIFSFGTPTYNPIKTPIEKPYKHVMPKPKENHSQNMDSLGVDENGNRLVKEYNSAFPENALYFPRDNMSKGKSLHPTQKPVALYEYLIKTYTNEGDTVLDIAMGSGTTIEAAERTGRNSIGIEKDEGIFQSAVLRLKSFTPSNKAWSGLVESGGNLPAEVVVVETREPA